MGKFNKKTKGKEKKLLNELQEEFNPSARDPYIEKKDKDRLEKMSKIQEQIKKVLKSQISPLEEDDEKEE